MGSFCNVTLGAVFILLSLGSLVFGLHCPECGIENEDRFLYCFHCGDSLQEVKRFRKLAGKAIPGIESRENHLFCPFCGQPNHKAFAHCHACGESLKGLAAQRRRRRNTVQKPRSAPKQGEAESTVKTYRYLGSPSPPEPEISSSDQKRFRLRPVSKSSTSKQPAAPFAASSPVTAAKYLEQLSSRKGQPAAIANDPKSIMGFLNGLLNGGGAMKVMGFQNMQINSNQLGQLQQNPDVQKLMNQMKSQPFQQQLINNLQLLKPNKPEDREAYQGQVNQIKSLLEMLNIQSQGSLLTP
jgi:hypothetical protein